MNILSLFDGMSCGQLALQRRGVKIDKYYASEIDKHAIKATMNRFPDTIQLGDVTKLSVRMIYLSEVHAYITEKLGDDIHSLQSIISRREMLYRFEQKQTLAAKIRTQVSDESAKVSEYPPLPTLSKIWFFRNPVGSDCEIYNTIFSRAGRDSKHSREWDEMLKYSFWWNGNRQHKSGTEEESICWPSGSADNGEDKRKDKSSSQKTVQYRRGKRTSETEKPKSVSKSSDAQELYGGQIQDKLGDSSLEKDSNRTTKEGRNYLSNQKGLSTKNDNVGFINEDRGVGSISKEMALTLVECEWGFIISKDHISLTAGGSPCQGFSRAGKNLSFEDPRSKLFWEYVRLLEECQSINPDVKFLLENVRMKEEDELVITKALGVQPIMINSALVSAQNRERLYWTNIGLQPAGLFGDLQSIIQQPKDKEIILKDILEESVDEKYYLSETALARIKRKKYSDASLNPEKTGTINTKNNSGQLSVDKGTTLIQVGVLNDRGTLRESGDKSNNIDANFWKGMDNHAQRTMIMVHNKFPRIGGKKRGGTGPLSRSDGKTYGLNTDKNINQIERSIVQINPSLESGGSQPFQQNRVYDAEGGLSPAIQAQLPNGHYAFQISDRIRRLTEKECCRLQTVPDDFFEGSTISSTQQYKMLGNGWTVDVICHILSYL